MDRLYLYDFTYVAYVCLCWLCWVLGENWTTADAMSCRAIFHMFSCVNLSISADVSSEREQERHIASGLSRSCARSCGCSLCSVSLLKLRCKSEVRVLRVRECCCHLGAFSLSWRVRLAHVVALIEIFGYISANLIALANGRALGVQKSEVEMLPQNLSGPILTPTL